MKVFQDQIHASTRGAGFVDVTKDLARIVEKSGITTGVAHVFIRHTSASLVIQENADPAVLRDLAKWIAKIAPESGVYEHDAEGADDMPSHLRSAITKTSETIPISSGRLALGTWQALYVFEHRAHGHRRDLVVTVMGTPA